MFNAEITFHNTAQANVRFKIIIVASLKSFHSFAMAEATFFTSRSLISHKRSW